VQLWYFKGATGPDNTGAHSVRLHATSALCSASVGHAIPYPALPGDFRPEPGGGLCRFNEHIGPDFVQILKRLGYP
jgi:hypothetical protein